MVEGATMRYTILVQFIQLPDHCTQKIQNANIFICYNTQTLSSSFCFHALSNFNTFNFLDYNTQELLVLTKDDKHLTPFQVYKKRVLKKPGVIGLTLFDCSRGQELALFDVLFSSVQC